MAERGSTKKSNRVARRAPIASFWTEESPSAALIAMMGEAARAMAGGVREAGIEQGRRHRTWGQGVGERLIPEASETIRRGRRQDRPKREPINWKDAGISAVAPLGEWGERVRERTAGKVGKRLPNDDGAFSLGDVARQMGAFAKDPLGYLDSIHPYRYLGQSGETETPASSASSPQPEPPTGPSKAAPEPRPKRFPPRAPPLPPPRPESPPAFAPMTPNYYAQWMAGAEEREKAWNKKLSELADAAHEERMERAKAKGERHESLIEKHAAYDYPRTDTPVDQEARRTNRRIERDRAAHYLGDPFPSSEPPALDMTDAMFATPGRPQMDLSGFGGPGFIGPPTGAPGEVDLQEQLAQTVERVLSRPSRLSPVANLFEQIDMAVNDNPGSTPYSAGSQGVAPIKKRRGG